jgi:hypothetical protein
LQQVLVARRNQHARAVDGERPRDRRGDHVVRLEAVDAPDREAVGFQLLDRQRI